jgi:hypothetical protein
MRKVYLHIGFGKTGTTAIQNFFYLNRDKFLKKGIHYPTAGIKKKGRHGKGHHGLAVLGGGSFNDKVRSNYSKLLHEIDEVDCDTVFLSSERFCFITKDKINYIAEQFKDAKVTIIFYVRRQKPLIESTFLQWQKKEKDYLGDINKFFNAHVPAFDLMNRIEPWATAFGKQNIIARVFDPQVIGDDVRLDLIKTLGWENRISIDSLSLENHSLLPEFSKLVNIIDRAKIDHKDRKRVVKELLVLSLRFKAQSSFELVSADLAETIKEIYFDSNKLFAQNYLDETQAKYLF